MPYNCEELTLFKASPAVSNPGAKPSSAVFQGDATQRSSLREACVDLTVTSPPYNVGKAYDGTVESDSLDCESYLSFTKKWLENCHYWTRSTGRLCANVSPRQKQVWQTAFIFRCDPNSHASGVEVPCDDYMERGQPIQAHSLGSWKSASAPHIIAPVETIIVLYKDEWKREAPGRNDIKGDEFKDWVGGRWAFNGESARRIGHEAPFPRELPRRCIKLFSFLGDTIFEPFLAAAPRL